MTTFLIGSILFLGFVIGGTSLADEEAAAIASAESAGPASVTSKATIKNVDGTVLREGSNGYTCYPQQEAMGPMCNEPVWDALMQVGQGRGIVPAGMMALDLARIEAGFPLIDVDFWNAEKAFIDVQTSIYEIAEKVLNHALVLRRCLDET